MTQMQCINITIQVLKCTCLTNNIKYNLKLYADNYYVVFFFFFGAKVKRRKRNFVSFILQLKS